MLQATANREAEKITRQRIAFNDLELVRDLGADELLDQAARVRVPPVHWPGLADELLRQESGLAVKLAAEHLARHAVSRPAVRMERSTNPGLRHVTEQLKV